MAASPKTGRFRSDARDARRGQKRGQAGIFPIASSQIHLATIPAGIGALPTCSNSAASVGRTFPIYFGREQPTKFDLIINLNGEGARADDPAISAAACGPGSSSSSSSITSRTTILTFGSPKVTHVRFHAEPATIECAIRTGKTSVRQSPTCGHVSQTSQLWCVIRRRPAQVSTRIFDFAVILYARNWLYHRFSSVRT